MRHADRVWKEPLPLVAVVAAGLQLAAACTPGAARLSEIRSMPYSLSGKAEHGSIVAMGCWVPTANERSAVATLNAAHLVCDRAQGRCTEALANLHSTLDPMYRETFGRGERPLLTSDITEFRITQWSPTEIRALSRPRAADVEIRVSLVEKAVVRVATETSARGAAGANPTPQVWRLHECNRR